MLCTPKLLANMTMSLSYVWHKGTIRGVHIIHRGRQSAMDEAGGSDTLVLNTGGLPMLHRCVCPRALFQWVSHDFYSKPLSADENAELGSVRQTAVYTSNNG